MVVTLLVLSAILAILIPVICASYLRRQVRVPWLYFSAGILTFAGAQLVHLPLNELLNRSGIIPANIEDNANLLIFSALLALTAALTEEVARIFGFWIVKRARLFEDGIMFGLGHGGLEVMIIGGVFTAAGAGTLWVVDAIDVWPQGVSSEMMATLTRQLDVLSSAPTFALAPLAERMIALFLHVSLSVLILIGFRKRNVFYWLLAVIYHLLVNLVAVYGAHRLDNPWLIEGLLAVMLAPGAYLLLRIRDEIAISPSITMPFRRFWSIFVVSTRKELSFQWRTKRFLIVVVVFLLFGMISPLLARFTPTLLRSIEGAEQFAELIPEPSVADAVDQYVKNITQFGFVLAILLGMGLVVGEREKGTAAMILSKPLPRWAFLLSKFCAQVVVYGFAFIVSTLAAYYYTLFLFEALPLAAFLGLNLLLFLWILIFAGVALLGSSLANSTGAAAGIAAVISVGLLFAGSVPRYGALAPSGLIAWGTALANGIQSALNPGSAAMGLVIILLAIIFSLTVLEQQEI